MFYLMKKEIDARGCVVYKCLKESNKERLLLYDAEEYIKNGIAVGDLCIFEDKPFHVSVFVSAAEETNE